MDLRRGDLSAAFNGINGSTGKALVSDDAVAAIAADLRGAAPRSENPVHTKIAGRGTSKHLAVRYGIDAKDLKQAGWGIVCARDEDPRIIAALQPLIEVRRAAADRLFKECSGDKGYQPGMTVDDFFDLHEAAPSDVEPEILPYYLLVVGGPERVPFEFQQDLDVAYAVGRIAFDCVEDYARYAQNVLRAEGAAPRRRAALFGPRHEYDGATALSSEQFLKPLRDALRADVPSWTWLDEIGSGATKERLTSIVTGDRPSLLMTAGHGVAFDCGDPRQRAEQGALLCQNWEGPGHAPAAEALFRAADVPPDADLGGMMAILFACFGGGTPQRDAFTFEGAPPRLAPAPFVAALPRAMLSLDRGALAVVAHVDRAWGTAFYWHNRPYAEVFRGTIRQIIDGHPIGYAMERFGQRYAQLSTGLFRLSKDLGDGKIKDDQELFGALTAATDAQFYALFGDPAARLKTEAAKNDG